MKKVVLILIVILIFIQFIRPDLNNSNTDLYDYKKYVDVPEAVQEIIQNSCADCHSNMTKYPWYNSIAPASWFLAQHINNGKEHLNFSEWGAYNEYQLDHILKDLEEVLTTEEMPLKSYLWVHKNAVLTADQYNEMKNWVKSISK